MSASSSRGLGRIRSLVSENATVDVGKHFSHAIGDEIKTAIAELETELAELDDEVRALIGAQVDVDAAYRATQFARRAIEELAFKARGRRVR